jgi:hypothetical protein
VGDGHDGVIDGSVQDSQAAGGVNRRRLGAEGTKDPQKSLVPVNDDSAGLRDPDQVLSKRSYRSSFPFRSVKAMVTGYLVPTLERKIQDLVTVGAYVDLIVAPSAHFAASIASELLGIPWVSVNLSPVSVPSAHVKPHPWPPPLPDRLQRIANRLQWGLAKRALRSIADEPINAIRALHGLPPRRNLLTVGNLSTDLAAVAVSPALVPDQVDWPPGLHTTGFCFWDAPRRWAATEELRSFFAAQRPWSQSHPDRSPRGPGTSSAATTP